MALFQLTAVASLWRALRMPADGLGSPPPQETPRPGLLHVTSRHQLPPHVSSDGSFKSQGKKRKKSPLPNEITRVVQSHGPTGTCLVIQQEAKQRMETRWEIFLWLRAVNVCCPLTPSPARLCVGCAGCPAPSRGNCTKFPFCFCLQKGPACTSMHQHGYRLPLLGLLSISTNGC